MTNFVNQRSVQEEDVESEVDGDEDVNMDASLTPQQKKMAALSVQLEKLTLRMDRRMELLEREFQAICREVALAEGLQEESDEEMSPPAASGTSLKRRRRVV